MKRLSSLILLVLLMVVLSCTESGTDSDNGIISPDAVKLLGLQDDFECRYIRYDSIFTYYPSFKVTVDTTELTCRWEATDSTRTRIDLWFDSTRSTALKITSNSIVNLGYFQAVDDHDSLFYFAEPPEIFPIAMRNDEPWESFTPAYYIDGEQQITSKLFLSWGLMAKREFEQRETLLLKLGSFNCAVFRCEYTLPGEEDIFKTNYEYYADDYGLVKLYSTGLFGRSHIYLIERDSLSTQDTR